MPQIRFENDELEWGGKKVAPSIRTLEQMKSVLAYPKMAEGKSGADPLYYMYRAVAEFGKVRYDITRIPSLEVCNELNKTFGHFHPVSPKGVAWCEIYEVLMGEAHFLIQKPNGPNVKEAHLLSAKKGECFLIPPGFGHVTINPGKKELVLANLVSCEFESDYSSYAKLHGACAYEAADGKIFKNERYLHGFELLRGSAREFSRAFQSYAPFSNRSLLEAAKNQENLLFLEKPELFR